MGLHFDSSEAQNAVIGGATVPGFGKNALVNQKLKKPLKPLSKTQWLQDGFHPSSFGYKLISEKLFKHLCEL
jgi:lysophospholipase L1-like esterase